MPMHNPPHPGEIVRQECLEPLGLQLAAVFLVLRGPQRLGDGG